MLDSYIITPSNVSIPLKLAAPSDRTNPLAAFRADAFLEDRRRLEAEEREASVQCLSVTHHLHRRPTERRSVTRGPPRGGSQGGSPP